MEGYRIPFCWALFLFVGPSSLPLAWGPLYRQWKACRSGVNYPWNEIGRSTVCILAPAMHRAAREFFARTRRTHYSHITYFASDGNIFCGWLHAPEKFSWRCGRTAAPGAALLLGSEAPVDRSKFYILTLNRTSVTSCHHVIKASYHTSMSSLLVYCIWTTRFLGPANIT